jgi:hypothetical protein
MISHITNTWLDSADFSIYNDCTINEMNQKLQPNENDHFPSIYCKIPVFLPNMGECIRGVVIM